MLGVADGIALGSVLDHADDVVLVYSGDGGRARAISMRRSTLPPCGTSP